MTRGNQRELARQRNAKKQQQKGKSVDEKGGNKGAGLEQRKQSYSSCGPTSLVATALGANACRERWDAEIMREKQKKAAEKKDK